MLYQTQYEVYVIAPSTSKCMPCTLLFQDKAGAEGGKAETPNPDLEEVQPEPLDMTIPTDSFGKALIYFILLPIVFPLWATLPDTRKQSCKYSYISLTQYCFQPC